MAKKYFILLSSIFYFSTIFAQNNTPTPKNIILMVGDGMGTAQLYAGYVAKKGNMNITTMPVSGFVKTNSANDIITDSGAAGSAMATGVKTNNGSISVDVNGIPQTTIVELAEKRGLATGLVVTCTLMDATPAAFVAHTKSRSNHEDIALDFIKHNLDVMIGGGLKNFIDRKDSLNLLDSLKKKGYTIEKHCVYNVEVENTKKLAALLADDDLMTYAEGRGDMLPKGTEVALEILSRNKKGFFAMIEGSQIDWACHKNDEAYLLGELKDFDDAVGKALEFAKNDGNTLIIVLADHETGGLSINGGNIEKGEVKTGFNRKQHSACMVPLFAYGPGAEIFSGFQDNTDIFKKCVKLLQLQ